MKYYSLNRKAKEVSFKDAVIKGLADDKGLYFPEKITPLSKSFFENIDTLSDVEIAFETIKQFVTPAIPEGILKKITEETIKLWKHLASKKHWRIVQLPNGFYQTEYQDPKEDKWIDVTRRETMDGAESAIDASVEHYSKKIEFLNGPKVVKTFK